ncbi:MAG: DNA helicase UvrD, partial [candidate division WOR-3 bacterium]
EEAKKEGRVGYKRLIPLREIIANSLSMGSKSRHVVDTYSKLTKYFGYEFRILIDLPEKDLIAFTDDKIAKAVIKVREENVEIHPGYDGVYGKILIPEDGPNRITTQKSLF